jgi:hypothetical protein
MRGGTSKCWIFATEELDPSAVALDELLENALGSGDPRQIDGVGGGTSTTSKVAIVSSSQSSESDVDYIFGQVGIADRVVEWGSNCGNCATAIALYAVQEGLIVTNGERTLVRLRNLNTGAVLHATVATPHGRVPRSGGARVAGVASRGVPVELTFCGPFHVATAFPTGRTRDSVTSGEHTADATIVSAGAPAILIDAVSVGMTASESSDEIASKRSMLAGFRVVGAQMHRLILPGQPAPDAVPKTGLVGPAEDYRTSNGVIVRAEEYDVAVRMLSMHDVHPAIGLTSAVAVATAAATPGTVVHCYRKSDSAMLRIGTLSGVIEVEWTTSADGTVQGVTLHRAARRLATALLHVPTASWKERTEGGKPLASADIAQPAVSVQ